MIRGVARDFLMMKPTPRKEKIKIYLTQSFCFSYGSDLTAGMRGLVCAFVECKQQSQGFSRRGRYDVEAQASWHLPGYSPGENQDQDRGMRRLTSVFTV